MTPEELEIVRVDGAEIAHEPDRFSRAFYDTLFEVAPDTRRLFPDDMTAQRGKLVGELAFLVEAAASYDGGLDAFLDRARELGRRHVGYGVTTSDYDAVRTALVAALRAIIADFDDGHTHAWNKLYRLIASAMHEGVATTPTGAG